MYRILMLIVSIVIAIVIWKLVVGVFAGLGGILFLIIEAALLLWLIFEIYRLLTNRNTGTY
ncbi:hypothetical protein CTKA_02734 [Chthonomonas calidirosea]|uniref:Uncharacterized protein n=1 Tax=Chthonomonas calidirosea (strain DSM 23976 / ICMP 18418 / T49) TaxID=1303518 RepID=S0EYT4_CHTCT|nr:hypothetical protein [Chthonomonas calidirosea]CCW35183.1 hypothetical protein CCALI_01365 [Chthonomonas calidirosea T49]CEK20800.1 hypothetical protein CTKA_02734 [Chthonomonas calidirosea]